MHLLNLTLGLLIAATVAIASAQAAPVEFTHRGVKIIGKDLPTDARYDIAITPAAAGAARVKEALDILYDRSAFNAAAIDRLKANGNVIIIYDPTFPKHELTQVTIAAFLPDFYQADGKIKDFVSVVGRFGAKWSARDLAAVLAHELTGHGIQHLRGRLEHVREVDLECEAYLYQENAYQDLGFNKQSRDMINFRQVLERHWCADFRRWQRDSQAPALARWDRLNPDVPKILNDYLSYIDALGKSGVAGRAIDRASAEKDRNSRQRLAKLAASDDPEKHFQLALIYRAGIGINVDPKASLAWMTKAADAGHAKAQFELGIMYWRGQGATLDKPTAVAWTRKAAEAGIIPAAYTYGAMLVNGDGVAKDRDAGITWIKKAADKDFAPATAALKKLKVN